METKTPARRALAVLDTPPAPSEPIAQRRISKKVRSGIDALVSGQCKTIRDASEKAGLSREHFTRELSKPHIAAYMHGKVVRQLAIAAARAGAVKGELLDSDNEMVRDRSSSFVLGLAGIAPASTPGLAVNIEIKAGYVIDLTDDPRPGAAIGMRIVSPVVYSPPAIDADLDQDSAE
jgi:hypothetical protein